MSLLIWNKTKRPVVDNWQTQRAHKLTWKAELVGAKTEFPQVEIRRDATVIVLSLKGYKYRHYDTRQNDKNTKEWKERCAKSNKFYTDYAPKIEDLQHCFHLATAGPLQLTLTELEEFKQVIEEGMQRLLELCKQPTF